MTYRITVSDSGLVLNPDSYCPERVIPIQLHITTEAQHDGWGHENKECWPILPNPYVPKNSKPPENE